MYPARQGPRLRYASRWCSGERDTPTRQRSSLRSSLRRGALLALAHHYGARECSHAGNAGNEGMQVTDDIACGLPARVLPRSLRSLGGRSRSLGRSLRSLFPCALSCVLAGLAGWGPARFRSRAGALPFGRRRRWSLRSLPGR